MNPNPTQWAQFLGHFHPVLLHFPIGFLALLGALEALSLSPRFKHLATANRAIVVLSIPATALTALLGWLLASEGGYNPDLLFWHRWTGVALVAATLVLFALHLRPQKTPFRLALAATLALSAASGHFGGGLTHGSDFLTRHAPEPFRSWFGPPPKPATPTPTHTPGASAFTSQVQPILEKYCSACHGPEKSKGDLRVDSLEAILKGGENGASVLPGDPDRSPLLSRCLLPPDHDDRMPPEGKPQPTPDELALLRRWIQAGASPTLP